jgi:hypothetical protein
MPDFQQTSDDVSSGITLVDDFIDAIATLEQDRNTGSLVELYAEDSQCGNVLDPERFEGPEGAEQFWSAYRSQFADVTSRYHTVVASENSATLEWQSEATINDEPLAYRGVTVLDFANGRITRSCAYFDPTAIPRQVDSISASR